MSDKKIVPTENDYLIWMQETDTVSDEIPERPDLYLYETEENFINYNTHMLEYEPCQCCGANMVKYVLNTSTCSVCGWEYDENAKENPDLPSKKNHDMSLDEAKMNFTAFGVCYPDFFEN